MKTVVSYAYYETNRAMYNFDFFVQTGLIQDPDILYIIVINGHNCSIEIPHHENIVILKRDNIGFDFGAHRASLDYLKSLYKDNIPYDFFIFLNCGVIGPFVPKYHKHPWITNFTDGITDKIKLFGTSLVCFEYKAIVGKGPHVEGFCFCLDKIGLQVVLDDKTVFTNHLTKTDAVNKGEYGLSKAILAAGYSLDCLLYKYQNIDWSDKKNWTNHNNNTFPSRHNSYENISIHPFEVIFHKWFWMSSQPVNFNYIAKYRKWKMNDIIKNKEIYATYGSGEYMVNVTNKIIRKFKKDNKIIIPVDYYLDHDLKRVGQALNNNVCILNIYINGDMYTIKHKIPEPKTINLENIYDLEVHYGSNLFKLDVTNKFINTFVKNNKIIIPKKFSFNTCFGDVCPGVFKKMYIKNGNKQHIICENNSVELEFYIALKETITYH